MISKCRISDVVKSRARSAEWGKQECGGASVVWRRGERVIEGEGWWGGEKWVTPSSKLTETQRYGNLTAAEDQCKRETGTEWEWAEGVWERASASVSSRCFLTHTQIRHACVFKRGFKLLNKYSKTTVQKLNNWFMLLPSQQNLSIFNILKHRKNLNLSFYSPVYLSFHLFSAMWGSMNSSWPN